MSRFLTDILNKPSPQKEASALKLVEPSSTSSLDDQIIQTLDDQVRNNLDDLKITDWTTENPSFGRPDIKILDDQNKDIGRPKKVFLDDKTTKKEIRSTKKVKNLDDQATKNKNLDDQTDKKPTSWKKYEKARATARIGLRPNAEILKKIKHFCVEQGMDVTEFFEIASLKYMDLVDQTDKTLVDKTTFDDRRLMINFKTKALIINLYLRYNTIFTPGTKWKAKDDETGSLFNDVDISIIELGIIQAQINKFQSDPTGSINSFKYYKQEIENFARLGLDTGTLQKIVEINRKNWSAITGKTIDLKFFESQKT